ncbi:hypothetical protein L6Q96_05390 [Candidatus Binatia bacterium]|nr:hypothetical protein [Candidatus Binatia bacterium]
MESATPTPTPEAPVPTLTPTSTTAPDGTCPGDCDRDGTAAVDELIVGVNIALNLQPMSACPPFDANGTGAVEIDDIVAAVNAALRGCPVNRAR